VTETNDCIFCTILRGDAPAHRVYEDEHVIAFMDLFPVAQAHTLIVPREHAENLFESTPEVIAAVGRASIPLARAIRTAFAPDGLGVYQANGAAAGQTVFHYHMHLIPQTHGVPLKLHGREQASAELLAEHAERLRKALDAEGA